MKLSLFTISISLLSQCATSFVSQPVHVRNSVILNAVELAPEPEGGEEITSLKTMEGSRMKNMGEVAGVKDKDGTVYKFWLLCTAEGALVKKLNTQVLKDAAKKADFPGFRKVSRTCAWVRSSSPGSFTDFTVGSLSFCFCFRFEIRAKFLLMPCHRSVGLLSKRASSRQSNPRLMPMD